jgi:uncharacterized protein YjbJ (UPF0337 family)
MDNDQMKGKLEQAKGYIKEKAGEATGNEELEEEGKVDKAAGSVREGYGEAKDKIRDATGT